MTVVCSICHEVYWQGDVNFDAVPKAWWEHYATHSWLRRKLHFLRSAYQLWRIRKKF